ncbi:MAG: RagB/SusD family nutrient uptake outer membrane protein [Marinifilum sp.]|jgi:hypothetical protein|nr:RagB/SusD family nutrient uptake outer membrane protein [Marinifilum sp.]
MKKIFVLIIAISSLMISCDDFLDLPPKNVITVQSEKDIKILVGSYLRKMELNQTYDFSYRLFRPSGPSHWGSNQMFREFEDNLDFSGLFFLFIEAFEEREFRWKSTALEHKLWNDLYNYIGDFNLYLYEIDNLGEVSEEMKAIKAEVLMNRALTYFRLAQYFCPYREGEYTKDPEKYGLPMITSIENLSEEFYPNRLSQKETYEFILNDLKDIEELNIEPTDFNFIYNKRAMYGLMAEFYMWRAESPVKEANDWIMARECAEKSIAGNSLINSAGELKALFNPNAQSGSSALRLNLPNGKDLSYGAFYNDFWNKIVVYDEVYNLYTDKDIRRDFYINAITRKVEKFNLADAAEKTNQSMWRVAEMHLIIAESYARQGDVDNARKYLNDFKKSRIEDFASYDGNDILDEIITERRKEFLCESNYRWYDMKRNGITYSRTSSKGEVVSLTPGDYRYSFIIPSKGELEENPNNFQNPGWDLNLDD